MHGNNHGQCVDLFAPGAQVPTGNRTTPGRGSAFAAAHVTGVAAVLLSVDPTLTADALFHLLRNVSTPNAVHRVPPDTPNHFLFNRLQPLPVVG